MKNMNDSIIRKYVKEVLRLTPATYRSRLKKELTNNIYERFHDTPKVTQSTLYKYFGTPQFFAADYLSSMDPDELQAHLTRSNKQRKHLLATLICILFLLIPIGIWIFGEEKRHTTYYYSETLTEYDTPQQQLHH